VSKRVFPCALGTFSVKRESVSLILWVRLALKREFLCALGTFSVKERVCLLVLRHDSYDMAERVFPCALGTFSVKRESLYFGYDSYNAVERGCVYVSLCFRHV
jgi:hypothetical protein